MHAPPRIGITMGDPNGIGPEILLDAVERLAPRIAAGDYTLVAIGSATVLNEVAARRGVTLRFASAFEEAAPKQSAPKQSAPKQSPWPSLPLVNTGEPSSLLRPGQVAAEAGQLAYLAVERAIRLALAGSIDAMVTGPISKEAINLAGHRYAGHTDMLAHLTGSPSSVMMLAHGPLRVTHVSTHIALSKVPSMLTPERLRTVLSLTLAALDELGIERPRIAIAALNPHAGEGGMFGREDIDITMPVVSEARSRGLAVEGPVPGDTVFVKAAAGQFDAVIAMYHDQGHIPVKLLGFRVDAATGRWLDLGGVNITLGLPIIRTSVDHGTAFDIAGRDLSNSSSLVEAIDYARRLSIGRRAKTMPAAEAR
ncbi:MAG: 4-hydroxythreonine-4-phosphate dehydrogenase PdxA [Hyphomicrobiales bacterium]